MYSNLLIIHKPFDSKDNVNDLRIFNSDTYIVSTNNQNTITEINDIFLKIVDQFGEKYFKNVGLMLYGFTDKVNFQDYVFLNNESDNSYMINYLSKLKSCMKFNRIDLFNTFLNYNNLLELQNLINQSNKDLLFSCSCNDDIYNLNMLVFFDKIIPTMNVYSTPLNIKNLYFVENFDSSFNFNIINLDNEPTGLLLAPQHIENIDFLLDNCTYTSLLVFKYDINWSFEDFTMNLILHFFMKKM